MLLEIHHVNLQVSDALDELARRQVERALRPFQESVDHLVPIASHRDLD